MAALDAIARLTDRCVNHGVPSILIKKVKDRPERTLVTFFAKEQIEDHLLSHARVVASAQLTRPKEIETVAITAALNDLANEIGFEELQRRVNQRLDALLPDPLARMVRLYNAE